MKINSLIKTKSRISVYQIVSDIDILALRALKVSLPLTFILNFRRGEMIAESFNRIEGVHCNPVQGAMYAFPQVE